MFWFNKAHPDTLYVDRRVMQPTEVGHGIHKRIRKCLPDKVMDFRFLELPDEQFSLVVFDPPHLFLGKSSHTAKLYGSLDKETYADDLKGGFAECFRVLKPDGVLIFKWNESNIPLREILALTPVQPLFGHRSGKASKTHWVTFMKPSHKDKEMKEEKKCVCGENSPDRLVVHRTDGPCYLREYTPTPKPSLNKEERDIEGWAINIVYQIGDLLYENLPKDVAHEHFIDARQATNDRAIDFAAKIIKIALTTAKEEGREEERLVIADKLRGILAYTNWAEEPKSAAGKIADLSASLSPSISKGDDK